MNNNVKAPIINVGVRYKNDLFFVLNNSNAIYKRDVDGVIHKLVENPFRTNIHGKICNIIVEDDRLWLIPMYERDIFCYDTQKKQLNVFPILNVDEPGLGIPRYRCAILVDDNIWILPNCETYIIKFNIHTYKMEKVENWPREISFSDKKIIFKTIFRSGNYIYVVLYECDFDMQINLENGKIEVIEKCHLNKYSGSVNNRIIVVPEKKNNMLTFLDNYLNVVSEISLPNEVWGADDEGMEFWHVRVKDRQTYICPYSARCLIIIDNCTFKISYVNIKDAYQVSSPVWDIIEDIDGFYVVFEDNPLLLYIDWQNKISIEEIDFCIDELLYDDIDYGMYYEQGKNDLTDFITNLM